MVCKLTFHKWWWVLLNFRWKIFPFFPDCFSQIMRIPRFYWTDSITCFKTINTVSKMILYICFILSKFDPLIFMLLCLYWLTDLSPVYVTWGFSCSVKHIWCVFKSFSSCMVPVIIGADDLGPSAADRTSGGLHVCDTVWNAAFTWRMNIFPFLLLEGLDIHSCWNYSDFLCQSVFPLRCWNSMSTYCNTAFPFCI